jgi:Spy/CpxP family protein refolding chaperone
MNGQSRRKAGLWLALVFVLGAAIGAVFEYGLAHKTLAAALATAPSPTSEPERRAKRVAEMTKELQLTPEQATSIDGIIHKAHDEMKGIHEKADSDLDGVRQKARDEMRQLLTPEQKPKFEVMVQKMDQERKKQQANQMK